VKPRSFVGSDRSIASTDMTREYDFILAAVRRFFRPGSALPSTEGLDWNLVYDLARRHSVAGFLQRECDAPALRERSLERARDTLALSAELIKLVDLFGKDAIDVIPLKGPVLGSALYKDEALKTSTDLDLLIRPRDALRAIRLLESVGYRPESVPHWRSEKGYLRNVNNELSFNDPALWLKLDLHWTLLPGYFPCPISGTELWTKARSVPWGSTHLMVLSPEHQVAFLCAHGVKHLWARLGWLCDLARLIQVEHRIEWSEVFDQARRSHTTRMILLSLLLARDFLGVELPPAAAALADADPQALVLASTVMERLRANRPASTVDVISFCVRALERTGDRARCLFGMTLQPTEAEYRVVQLPPALYWVYYLLRPLRLTAKYIGRLICGDSREFTH
jgi:Uncharacterised nucleotidyltransferase